MSVIRLIPSYSAYKQLDISFSTMSPQLNFTVLNVFTPLTSTPESPGGNPLAIVHLQADTSLTIPQKSSIARNFGYPGTVFLHPPQDGDEAVRAIEIFTEVGTAMPFGGHPTIGTANYLFQLHPDSTELTLLTPAGQVLSSRVANGVKVEVPGQIPPQLKLQPCSPDITARLKALQPGIDFVGDARTEVMTGITFILMHVATEHGLSQLRPYPALSELPGTDNPRFAGTYFYVLHPSENGARRKVRARMFFGEELEDPASGAAACALTAYLKIHEGITEIDVCQGVEMGCESVFAVSLKAKVSLEGRSVITKEGVVDTV
jgi:PhzF family phenazine biosynthesis protein